MERDDFVAVASGQRRDLHTFRRRSGRGARPGFEAQQHRRLVTPIATSRGEFDGGCVAGIDGELELRESTAEQFERSVDQAVGGRWPRLISRDHRTPPPHPAELVVVFGDQPADETFAIERGDRVLAPHSDPLDLGDDEVDILTEVHLEPFAVRLQWRCEPSEINSAESLGHGSDLDHPSSQPSQPTVRADDPFRRDAGSKPSNSAFLLRRS